MLTTEIPSEMNPADSCCIYGHFEDRDQWCTQIYSIQCKSGQTAALCSSLAWILFCSGMLILQHSVNVVSVCRVCVCVRAL
jgi:hypothetical protein